MIDMRALRENPEPAKASQIARGADPADVDRALEADKAWREALSTFESRRAEQKALSKQIGQASKDERPAILARAKEMAAEVKELEAAASAAEQAAKDAAYVIPNIVNPGVPAGGEDDYVVLATHGEPRDFAAEGVTVRDHLEVGEGLDIIDTKRGAKVSGSRFYFLKGLGARLEIAMLTCGLDVVTANGFTPMITPTMVSPRTMGGTGFLGKHADEIYYLPADDLYLTGTSEVALAGYHTDEIIDVSDGPIRYAGWSSCYRREAGSHGKDVRGIIRVHQFNKVEMFAYTLPEDSFDEHKRLLAIEEEMLTKLELPYRVIHTAAGDLGSSAAEKFDCEAWLPSQQRYLELTSTSNCTTFQARRLGIRYRGEDGTQPVATLNGTVINTRWIVPFLENHQQADGSVYIPKALRPYMGGREVIEAPPR